jgi:hypothetical protein
VRGRGTWRRLERAVASRILERDCELKPRSRILLLAVVRQLAGGGPFPSRRELAAQLGYSERTLHRALEQLVATGLVHLEDQGSRPDQWALDVDLTERWAIDGAPLPTSNQQPATSNHLSGQNGSTSAAKMAAQNGQNGRTKEAPPSLVEDAVAARAGVHAREEVPAEDLGELERRAVRALLDAGWVSVSRGSRMELMAWLRAGTPVEDVEYAARECDRHGKRTIAYLESVLERLHDEHRQRAAEPLDIDDYRRAGGA